MTNFSRRVDAILDASPGLTDSEAIAQAAHEINHPQSSNNGDFWHLREGDR